MNYLDLKYDEKAKNMGTTEVLKIESDTHHEAYWSTKR